MNVMVKTPDEVAEDRREPTRGEQNMANSLQFLIEKMIQGDLKGLAVCAVNSSDEETCLYINSSTGDVLSQPIQRLRVMYETNRSFGRLNTSPKTNRSYREH